MKNKITDVHNVLMQQLDRLNELTDLDSNPLSAAQVEQEFKRAKAINETAENRFNNSAEQQRQVTLTVTSRRY